MSSHRNATSSFARLFVCILVVLSTFYLASCTFPTGGSGSAPSIYIPARVASTGYSDASQLPATTPPQTTGTDESVGIDPDAPVWIENDFIPSSEEPLSTFSIDVDTASYAIMRSCLTKGLLPNPATVRIEEYVNYFDYSYPRPIEGSMFSVCTEMAECPWNPASKLLRIGLATSSADIEHLPPMSITLLADVSGSMSIPARLDLAKESFIAFLANLREGDKVSLVTFECSVTYHGTWTVGKDIEKGIKAIKALRAQGGTCGEMGLKKAYEVASANRIENGVNRIIFATDGDFNVGMTTVEEFENYVIQKRTERIYLSILGFGISNVRDTLLERIADKGNGHYSFIDSRAESNKVLFTEFRSTLYVSADDVKVQVEFNPKTVALYRLIGYENRLLSKDDFANDKVDAGEFGSGRCVTALYELYLNEPQEKAIVNTNILAYPDNKANSFCVVRLRYKMPGETESKLIEEFVEHYEYDLLQTSADFRFASAVAAYAQILRKSKYVGIADFASVYKLASSAKGADIFGHRAEFIKHVKQAEAISQKKQ